MSVSSGGSLGSKGVLGRWELLRDDAGVGIRWDGMKLKIFGALGPWQWEFVGSDGAKSAVGIFATLSFMAGIGTLDGRHLKFRDVWATGG